MDDTSGQGYGPVFIGGLSYSGKTPLRLMLSSHPNLALSRRTYMWQRYFGRFGDLADRVNFDRCLAAMLARPSIQALSPDADQIRRDFGQGPATYGHLFAVIHAQFAASVGKGRWGAQIGLIEEYADVIFADYPGARMIHMVCDPRQRWQQAANGRRRTGKLGWETARWLHSARLARRNQARYPGRYLVVNREALDDRPEATLRDICDFLGETYRPQMLTMEAAIRFGDEAQVKEPPAAGRTLPRRDLAFTQAYAGRQIADFGYQVAPLRLSFKDQLLFQVLDRPANLASLVAWRAVRSLRSPASRPPRSLASHRQQA
jgi:hypothetical protein